MQKNGGSFGDYKSKWGLDMTSSSIQKPHLSPRKRLHSGLSSYHLINYIAQYEPTKYHSLYYPDSQWDQDLDRSGGARVCDLFKHSGAN
jgi:hypothetical protein